MEPVIEPKKSVWQKIKDLPKISKILICSAALILATVTTLVIVFKRTKVDVVQRPIPENWEKLVVGSKYQPLYILSPKTDRKFGIVSQEIFSLKTKDPVDANFVKDNLVTSKPVTITQKGPTEFEVTPIKPLGTEETITMTMKNDSNYSWIFETAPKLKVVEVLPRDQATNVPINTGVEFTFNNDSYNLQNSNIVITPNIDFRLEKHDQKTALVPLTPLKPKTLYIVTVKKDAAVFSDKSSLSSDYSFSFQTGDTDPNKSRLELAKDFQEVFPDEALITKVHSGNIDINQTISTKVYKFAGLNEFISSRSNLDKVKSTWSSYYGEDDQVDTKNMSAVLTADLKIQTQGTDQQLQYLQLPKNLDEGFYLVQFWFDNGSKVEQLWVESSSIPGYVSVGKLQTAVWINSVTGEDVGNSVVKVLGSDTTYSTNNQGWAAFPTSNLFFDSKIRHYVVITTTSGRNLVVPIDSLSSRAKPGDIVADDYWSYLYQERLLYKPNDTVYFWGVAKNKDSGTPPTDLDVYLGETLAVTVHPESDGSYLGKIQLTNSNLGYNSISTKIKDTTLNTSYFQVEDYVKPELKIEVNTPKKVMYAGEEVNFRARVTFFDGTPATNMKLFINSYSGTIDKSEADADKNGEVNFTYKSKVDSVTSYPRYEDVIVSADKSGEKPSDGIGTIYVYGSQLQIDSTTSQTQEHASLQATVKTLDLNLVNNQGLSNPVSGVAKNQKVALVVTKTWWEQKQTGTYYDFVEKVTRPSYDYIRHDEVTDKKDLSTDGNGQLNYAFTMEKNKSYQVGLSTTDSASRPAISNSYFYYADYQANQNQTSKAYMDMVRDTNLFSVNDEVDIKIQKSGNDYVKTDKSKFLFILAERGNQEVVETESPELKFNFATRYLPEVYVGALIFNGRTYEEVTSTCKNGWICGGYDYYNNDYFFDPLIIRYQKEDSKLDINVTADKVKYLPGETAHVSVRVTKGNNPVTDSTVQLTLVDEALAAIGGVREPSISELYKQSSNLIYYNYYSHRPVLPDVPQAERGGGGGGRDLFKDTAYFGTAKTDGSGTATFEVKLPDNITNWLTYAQSITSGLDYGQVKSSIIATKEFFVTSQFPHIITVKDQPVIAVGTFGISLSKDAKIPLTISVSKDNMGITKNTLTVNAFKEGGIEFPQMTSGNYSVTVNGDYSGFSDGLTLPSQIIDSRLNFRLTKNSTLTSGQTLKSFDDVTPASDKPIKLTVADAGKGKYYYDLINYCYQNSNRVEKRIASIRAGQILKNRFKETDCNLTNQSLKNFQSSDGGLRQVEWGASNLETTLWATYVDPSQFDKASLIRYFETNDTYDTSVTVTEKGILKNWGLTLLGKPNINELNRLANSSTTYKEKVLAALALYSAGNKEKSKEMYFSILSNYAYTNKPYLRIEADSKKRDYDTFALDTSYALLLGTLTVKDYNSGFNLYLDDYGSQVSTVILDIANISYLDNVLATLPDTDSIITFKSKLQSITQNVSKKGVLTLNLSANETKDFNLKIDSGKIDATLNYAVNPNDFAKLEGDNRLTLTKNVTKVKGGIGSLQIGDILRVDLAYHFDAKAPLGCYNLTDYIPSGMTLLENYNDFGLAIGRNGYMYGVGNNTVTGCAYNSKWWNDYTSNRSVYFVRITGAGKFIQEPTIMQSELDPTIFQKTGEDYVKIGQ